MTDKAYHHCRISAGTRVPKCAMLNMQINFFFPLVFSFASWTCKTKPFTCQQRVIDACNSQTTIRASATVASRLVLKLEQFLSCVINNHKSFLASLDAYDFFFNSQVSCFTAAKISVLKRQQKR